MNITTLRAGPFILTEEGTKLLDAREWVKLMEQNGAGELLLTSMDMDGTKKGYDLAFTKMVSEEVEIPVIASGVSVK